MSNIGRAFQALFSMVAVTVGVVWLVRPVVGQRWALRSFDIARVPLNAWRRRHALSSTYLWTVRMAGVLMVLLGSIGLYTCMVD
jgi:hypothetical protein